MTCCNEESHGGGLRPAQEQAPESGNKGDLIDARKLAELLRNNSLSPVYHGGMSALEVQHRTRSYTMLTEDTTRVMNRLRAVFRSQAIRVHGRKLFRSDLRESHLAQLATPGLRQRAESLYRELDALHPLAIAGQARNARGVSQAPGHEVAAISAVPG